MAAENKTLVPVWICYVDGKRLDTKHEGALIKIKVNDKLNEIGKASLFFDCSAEKILDLGSFKYGSEVSIHLGYKDDVEEVFRGEVTGFEILLKEGGHEMCEVECSNVLHLFEHGRQYKSVENKKASDVVKDIIEAYSLKSDVDDFGAEFEFDVSEDISDLDLVLNFCNLYGKDLYAYGDTVYIKDNIQVRDDDVIFEWGKSLINFKAGQRIDNLFSEVNFIGWDNQKNEAVSANSSLNDITVKVGGSKTWNELYKNGSSSFKCQISKLRAFDNENAKNIATGILTKNSFEFMTATGKGEGTYKLLPGMRVNIKYVGKMFEGEYIAESVIHEFDINTGYVTSFILKRNMGE